MDQKSKVTDLGVGQSKHPELETVVELPAVNVFQGVFCQTVAYGAQVHTQLPDILETKLVPNRSVDCKQLNETVLRGAKSILNIVASTTYFTGAEEFVVHALKSGLIEGSILGPHDT